MRAIGKIMLLLSLISLIALGMLHFANLPEELLIRTRAINGAREAISSADWMRALHVIQVALQQNPDDWELLIWQAVLQEKLAIGASPVVIEQRDATAFDILVTQAMVYLLVDMPQSAVDTGLELIRQFPEAPQGYFIAAQAYERLGMIEMALDNYQQTANRAQYSPEFNSLYLISREAIGILGIRN